MIEDIKKMQLRLGRDMKELTTMLDTTLATIPEEGMEKVKEARADMRLVVNSIKKGQSDVANQIIEKYANSNR
jgi:hypothetical protein|tara:strand:+ start:3041 stop:3259 length:219 start_codon:yes stop_codon:yes gene_type:complete